MTAEHLFRLGQVDSIVLADKISRFSPFPFKMGNNVRTLPKGHRVTMDKILCIDVW